MRPSSRPAPILIVGAPRSGTTWLGEMLSLGERCYHVYEPFNRDGPRPLSPLRWPFQKKVTYITDSNEASFLAPVQQLFDLRIPVEIFARRSARADLRSTARDLRALVRARQKRERLIIKDSTALYYAPWLQRRFGARVVVILRHPCGPVAGFKRMGTWVRGMQDWLDQPQLMADLLEPYREDLIQFNQQVATGNASSIDYGLLEWRMAAHALAALRTQHPEWTIVRHEHLSMDPIPSFQELYGKIGLNWSADIEEQIRAHTKVDAPVELGSQMHVLKRDSRAVASEWTKRLTPTEIARVRRETEAECAALGGDFWWPEG